MLLLRVTFIVKKLVGLVGDEDKHEIVVSGQPIMGCRCDATRVYQTGRRRWQRLGAVYFIPSTSGDPAGALHLSKAATVAREQTRHRAEVALSENCLTQESKPNV